MTDLATLRVSLTKHGAHKAADLIKAFPKEEVLENLSGTYRNINIDRAQTQKNLSAYADNSLPQLWDDIRQLGDRAIDNLVLLAIIFSHHELIETMRVSKTTYMRGVIYRGQVIDGKIYTNFACILEELRFSIEHTHELISYDLSQLFEDELVVPLVRELLTLKLKAAGWDEGRDLVEECLSLGLHDVFSISQNDFRLWLGENVAPNIIQGILVSVEEEPESGQFIFSSGHHTQPEGNIKYHGNLGERVVKLLHNEISNKLYEYLVGLYGNEAVGTEIAWGQKSIDVVVRQSDEYVFYEIKTNPSIQACMREALGQLMEYSYWPNARRANRLIVVSYKPITSQASQYVHHLRDTFALPIYYQQFDLTTGTLSDIV